MGQLQEETLEEDQARPVNTRIYGSQHPSIPTSARNSSCWVRLRGGNSSCFVQILWLCSCLTIKDLELQLLGSTAGREQQLFCTDNLVMLMFDNKRSGTPAAGFDCGEGTAVVLYR